MDDRLQHLASLLAQHGVRHAFGITGSGQSLSLIAALEKQGVAYHPASHEAAAAMMAGGATAADTPAVCISIKGPGLANQLPGIACNAFENRPVLSISEAFGPATPSFRKHKRLDHAGLLSPLVKGSITLDRLPDLPALLATATAESPGPVHLDLCDGGATVPTVQDKAPGADEPAIAQAAAALDSAKQPIVIVGSLALRRGYGELLAKLDVPVFTTAAGKGAIDESLPHAAGVYTGDGKAISPEAVLLPQADLVLGIGLRNTELLSPKKLSPRTILLDEVSGDLADGLAGELLIVDVTTTKRLIRCLAGASWGLPTLAEARRAMRDRLLVTGAWSAPAAIHLLNAPPGVLSARTFATVADTGSFCTIAEHLIECSPGAPWFGSNNGRYMGTSLPTAIGVAFAGRGVSGNGRPVVCLVGDGGIRMHIAELRLAIAERLPLCVILMSDGRFGSVACAAGALANHRAVGVDGANWWQVAQAMGCQAVRVESFPAFQAALASWQGDAPLFIEAGFESNAYAAMTKDLR